MILVVAKSIHTRGKLNQLVRIWQSRIVGTYISRQMAPALLLVAFLRIASSGVAVELMTVSMSGETNRRTIRKIVPVTVPITTQPIMILGPSTDGLGISVVS